MRPTQRLLPGQLAIKSVYYKRRSYINILVATQRNREPRQHCAIRRLTRLSRLPPQRTAAQASPRAEYLHVPKCRLCAQGSTDNATACATANAARPRHGPVEPLEAGRIIKYPHAHYSTSPQHGAAPVNVPGSEIRDNKPAGVQGGSPPTKNRQQIRQSSTHNGQRRAESPPHRSVQ